MPGMNPCNRNRSVTCYAGDVENKGVWLVTQISAERKLFIEKIFFARREKKFYSRACRVKKFVLQCYSVTYIHTYIDI